jgi:hypothetical protein
LVEFLLETDKDNEKLFGKKKWAFIKKHQQEVKAGKLQAKKSSSA